MNIKEVDVDTPQKRQRFTVGVIGSGPTLLQHGCVFAEAGFKVVAVDLNHHHINIVKKSTVFSTNSTLDMVMEEYLKDGRLTMMNNIRKATSKSDVIIFLVQPLISQKKKPDYSKIERTCKEVGIGLRLGCLVIVTGTMGPGVTESLVKEILENASGLKAGVNFGLAYSPLYAGSEVFTEPSATYKMVVGGINKQSLKIVCLILSTIAKELLTVRDMKTAEAVRLFRDVYQDLNVALANEFARYCEKAGIDFIEVQRTASEHLHCYLPTPKIATEDKMKALHLLLEEAEAVNAKLPLLMLTRKTNEEMLRHALRLVRDALRACDKPMRRAKVSILGISCQPNVKEFQGSITKKLVRMMRKKGMLVRVYDPLFSFKELTGMEYPAERTLKKTIEGADCLVVTVGHDQFKRLKLRKIKFLAKKTVAIVDMAHVINPFKAEREGFVYRGVGRGVWAK
jgi:nucleotide sugar dehydrogenase